MGGPVGDAALPSAVFVGLVAGAALQQTLARGPAWGVLGLRPRPDVDPASVLLWALAVVVVAAATWNATQWERAAWHAARRGVPPPPPPASAPGTAAAPAAHALPAVSARGAFVLIAAATVVLLGMYALVRVGASVVAVVTVLFCVPRGLRAPWLCPAWAPRRCRSSWASRSRGGPWRRGLCCDTGRGRGQ
jgi:hypothetical protein